MTLFPCVGTFFLIPWSCLLQLVLISVIVHVLSSTFRGQIYQQNNSLILHSIHQKLFSSVTEDVVRHFDMLHQHQIMWPSFTLHLLSRDYFTFCGYSCLSLVFPIKSLKFTISVIYYQNFPTNSLLSSQTKVFFRRAFRKMT